MDVLTCVREFSPLTVGQVDALCISGSAPAGVVNMNKPRPQYAVVDGNSLTVGGRLPRKRPPVR